jgi:hypothetical protein
VASMSWGPNRYRFGTTPTIASSTSARSSMKWVMPISRHIVAVDAGSLKEAVVVEPLHCSILNASTALGDNPDGLNHAQGSQEQTPMDDRSWPAALDMLGALSARSGP